jgi:hypothetical protein
MEKTNDNEKDNHTLTQEDSGRRDWGGAWRQLCPGRVYQTGEIGRVLYAEGEYNHPMGCEENASICLGENHWRNWLPSTYYCTHALAPLMYITDTMPTMVNGLSVAAPDVTEADYAGKRNDPTSVILCRHGLREDLSDEDPRR